MYRMTCLVLALAVAYSPIALACMHMPKSYKGSIEQTAQSAIIMWQDGRQELILKNDFRITPGDDGQIPAALAWIVPVPTKPDHYSVEKTGVFRDLFEAWENDWQKANMWGKKGEYRQLNDDEPESEKHIKLHKKVSVGEYEIQPISTVGKAGGKALNAWLTKNGFGAVPAKNMAYYVERDWVWLAVKVNLTRGTTSAVRRGGLRPLRISFASKQIVYPLLFSTHQGEFDVVLWILTKDRLPNQHMLRALKTYKFTLDDTVELAKLRKQFEGWLANDKYARQHDRYREFLKKLKLPASLVKIQSKAAKQGHWKPIEHPSISKLVGQKVNGKNNPLAAWKDDFRIAVGE